MVVANPTLDSISAFSAPDGSGNVTATVSFSGQYAPTYVLGTNTYIVDQKISISGADDSQNNGRFIIVSVTGGTTVAGTIVFANPSGVAKSNQFAVCSPAPIMLKDMTTDVAITIATPFSYAFEASSQWTPPPTYTTSGITGYAYATSNGYDPRGTVTGTTSLTIPFHPASGDTIINIYLGFAAQKLQTLYPYKFNPTITLPVVTGVPEPNGSSYVTFDVATPSSKCLIYGNYSLGYPTAVAAVGSDQYIVDKTNSVIRKLTAGVPTIFAGQIGVHTNTDGAGLSAAFTDPVDIVYANSKLYVSDGTRIRSIVISTATVSTIVTGGNIAGANGLAWDGDNLLYVACNSNGKVCSVNLTTFAVTVITTGIAHPTRIAYDFGANLYVTDAIANKIYQIIISGGTTTVLAGTGTAGSADGSLTAATFSGPVGITFDETNFTLFVCDTGNNTLRAIDIGLGWVWTIAGLAGTSPADVDGAGTVARFNTPTGILWKDLTHMIISEPTGSLRNVTVVYTGASATVATSLLSPLTLATNGNYLYVACSDTDILRIDTTNGTTTTTSFGEALAGLKGITVDSTGTYMYAAALSGLITRIALLDNIPTTVAGVLGSTSESDNYLFTTWATPPLLAESAYLPIGCAVGGDKTVVGATDGNIYVWAGTEWLVGNISGSWRAARTFPLIACSGDGSIMVAAPSISNPVSTGNYVVSISTNSGADWFIGTITSSLTTMIAAGIAISDDGLKIYVSDLTQNGVWIGTGGGTSWSIDNNFFVTSGGYLAYAYISTNPSNQRNVVAAVENSGDGQYTIFVGTPGLSMSTYSVGNGESPFVAIAMNADGYIAVAETSGYIYISPNLGGNWYTSTSAGNRNWTGIVATSSYYIAITNTSTIHVSQSLDPTTQWYTLSTDVAYGFFRAAVSPSGTNCIILSTATTDVYSCTGPSSTFNLPQLIAIDSTNDYLYVTDAPAGTVRQITLPTGQVTTVATGLVYPQGIVMANSTHVYVADRHRIVYIDVTSGTKTVIAGSTSSGNVNGNGATARFNNPQGLALDSTNSILYVADTDNDAIRRIDLTSPFNVTTLSISQSFTQPIGLVLNSALTSLYISVANGGLYSATVTPTTTVSTSQSTIPTGANAVIIGGNSYIYTTPATLTCTPAIDGLSYSISFNGGSPVTFTTTTGTLLPTIAYAGIAQVTDMTILYRAPIPISAYFPTEYPYVRYITGTSADLVPFISSPDTLVTISSTEGFIHSGTLTYVLQLFSDVNFTVFETASNSFIVTAFSIIVTPPLTSPLDLYMYGPFTYTFSLPEDTVNVTLNAVEYSSSALIPYISSSSDKATLTFSSTGATVSTLLQNLNVKAFVGTNPNELTSSSTVVNILPAYLVATPPIPSGVPINLYKYEEFTYAFAVVGLGTTLTLRYSRSSVQLAPYIKVLDDGSIEFTGTPPASYSSTFVLAIDLMNGTSVVSSLDYPVTISAGRIKFLPASPYALNQYENISNTFGSNIAWESSNAPDSIVSIPTLPYGLSFSSTAITGIPQTQQAQRNYQIIGSNSTNGSISTANIAISVGVPVVRISPASASFAGLGIGSTPTTTFTALVPATIYSSSFVYTWSPSLPAGLVFTDIDGTTVASGSFSPADTAKTIKLAGTPTMTDATGFPSSGLVTVTLRGIYRDATNVQTIGTATLALQFAETVLMTANVSSSLYVGKTLGTNDVTFTAASYFPSTSLISNFTISALPPGLSLLNTGATSWRLTGTPTSAGTTAGTITAVNFNAITNTIPYTIVINPDVVTFTLTPPSPTFVVSRILPPGAFQVGAVATSGAAITYTSSVNLALYGLSLGSVSGIVSGTPTGAFSGTVIFTATDALGASNTYTVVFTISEDTFAWPGYAPTYFQNRAVTPYQLIVTTTSGRTIQSFSSTNMPAGLTLSPSGLITGTPTVSTGGTFTVTATTGYQAPSNASYSFTYTVIADNLLMVQVNGVDPISNAVFNAPFITIPYSTGTSVNPVYSFTTYPLQYPAPVFTVSQSGVLTGDFTGVPAPYSLYNAGITATYGGITNTTNVVISMSNAPTPFLVAGYWNISGNGLIVTTAPSYVFNASTSGTPVIANQTWTTGLTAADTNVVGRPAYPDIATNGPGLVAITPSNVYDGAYNSTTNSVVWTASISSSSEIFGCVTSDGGSNWVIVAKTGTAVVSYERSGNAGAWTRRVNSTGFITNPSSMTTTRVTLGYVNGYYVYGQYAASGAYCNVLYRTVTGTAWRFPATPPTLDEVYRFATSNTTIVAVGYGTSPSYNPMSYSTSLTAWTSPTLPAWLSATASTYVYDIAYGGGMWVMVGMASSVGSFIAYSPDLSNWVQYIPTTPSGVQSLATWSWVSLTFNGNAWTIAGTYYTTGPYYHSGILTLDAGQWPNQTSKVAVDTMVPSGYLNPVSRIVATAFSNTSSFSGTVSSSVGPLTFTQPTQSAFTLYQYVPYDITVQATGASGFKYYYAFGVPVGFQFTPETTGTTASITGISPSNGTSIITLYAKTASSTASATQVRLNTVIPFFVNPQSGAGAYTAIVREHVDADAAQNARDNRTFPQVDSLAGPFMAPRAPDVVTQSNCFLGLCKKPCPTCRTMM